ncbi:hypothetical protein ABMA27_007462 [Loxostege sticticalis]|uniref:Protein FAM161A n=1 Tax=Loxostege sticticalis TaxID=481309 RepID=A0ABR3HFH6_LOXSC
MTHRGSVFKNSCLRLPVDPISKMPKTAYERKSKPVLDQCSINSPSTVCSGSPDVDAEKLKDFYRSIPDYNDINHLPEEEFYFTLRSLREKKKKMLNQAVEHIDDCNGFDNKVSEEFFVKTEDTCFLPPATSKKTKSKINNNLRKHYCDEKSDTTKTKTIPLKTTTVKKTTKKTTVKDLERSMLEDIKVTSIKNSAMKEKSQAERQKRNHSACSITWNDAKLERSEEIDDKFDQFFEGKKYSPISMDDEFKTQSMPSSPLRSRRAVSPMRKKNITIPKPFKMTERDEEDRIVHELRSLRKSFSEDMLHQKCERKQFRAKPVPIESRIPLYDKILEDQAMRRAITKINSEAELRAQMKPFSFTKREEKGLTGMCERAIHVLPKSRKKKRFRARSMNRRIRAEEMLRASNYPGTMAARDRSRLSTPAAHSDLPIDPSPAVPSSTSSERRPSSPMKCRRREKGGKEDLITTSPQPFRFTTADRAAKKMQDVAKKMYQESKCTESVGESAAAPGSCTPGARAYSALDLRAAASGRSNLAALLRAEAVRRKFEMESARRLAEQRRRMELRHRDRLLRSKPAWHLVKNNHEEDIAMRLQTRRDEEKMRREEFLHEMELMYGRVQQQPMLFERYYAPRPHYLPSEMLQMSPRKVSKKRSSKSKSYHYNSPNRSRKVSINDTAETFNGDLTEYLNRVDDDKYSDSEVALDSLDGGKR